MDPQVSFDEGDMVVIDLSGKGEWLLQGDKTIVRPEGTWWVSQDTAEKLMLALVHFFHPKIGPKEDGNVF